MQLEEITNLPPDKRTFSSSPLLLLNRRNIGIEIELENYDGSLERLPLWSLVSDGSLRNGGIELVSEILRGEDIVVALGSAEKAAKKHNLVVSDRCSVHIHLDIRNTSREELVLLVVMYCIFEDVFFQEGGDITRRENNHCRPVCSSQDLARALGYFMSADSPNRANDALRGWNKYTALNLLPVSSQGSIEFRHHVGTYSSKEIIKWVNLIFSLASFAKKYRDVPLQDCIDRVCGEPETLFNEALRPLRGTFSDEIHEGMFRNSRFIQVASTYISIYRSTEVGEGTEEGVRPTFINWDNIRRNQT